MKKKALWYVVYATCILLILPLCIATFAYAAPQTVLLGDVNRDNKVNTGDATLILRNSVGLITFSDVQTALADANNDGSVNTGDATHALRISVGLAVAEQVELELPDPTPASGEVLLMGDTIQTECEDVIVTDTTATIINAGSYLIKGTLTNGQIVVDTESDGDVCITFDGVDITCLNSAAFYAKNADKVIITLADGSQNTLSDTDSYVLPEGEDEPKACIFSADDLTIEGQGELTVHGNYNNGIMSKDDLKIKGGTITVTAQKHALRGNDSVSIRDFSTVNITAGGDGIQTDNAEDTDKGYVEIKADCDVTINAVDDGIQADRLISIFGDAHVTAGAKGLKSDIDIELCGGNINLDTTEDAINANNNVTVTGGVATIITLGDAVQADNTFTLDGGTIIAHDTALKGINVGALCTISSGTIDMVTGEDGINSTAAVEVFGGLLKLISKYDGIQADTAFTMTDGIVDIASGSGVATADDSGKCIKAGEALTISGGKTTLISETDDGIHSDGTITISGGSNNVTAGLDGIDAAGNLIISADITLSSGGSVVDTTTESGKGIKSDTDVRINGGTLILTTFEDAIHSNASVAIDGGNITIVSTYDGIQAETALTITNGVFDITCGKGYNGPTTSASAKGIKGIAQTTISGGTFTVNSKDDCIHSDGTITISGGLFNLRTSDDAIHADTYLYLQGGEIVIENSYEGLEAKYILASGGRTSLTSSDDGINCSDPSETSGGGPGMPPPGGGGSGTCALTISDNAYLWVNASGDGVDVNGGITMTGGTLIVNGPTGNGNGILDFDSSFYISGGYLFAIGNSGMLQVPSSSTQCVMRMSFSSNQSANSLIRLQSSNNTDLFTYKPLKQYKVIVFSAPELTKNTSYSVYSGGTSTGTLDNGMYIGGTYSGGTLRKTFTTGSTYSVNVTV